MSPEPRIVAFACNWCSYAAADLAGAFRLSYPAGLRMVRVMCSGMVHPDLVMLAFQQGADGVMVMGCPAGGCHYQEGNAQAEKRLAAVEALLESMGLEADRFGLVWCSSTQAERFAAAVRAMDARVRELGPSPYRRPVEYGAAGQEGRP